MSLASACIFFPFLHFPWPVPITYSGSFLPGRLFAFCFPSSRSHANQVNALWLLSMLSHRLAAESIGSSLSPWPSRPCLQCPNSSSLPVRSSSRSGHLPHQVVAVYPGRPALFLCVCPPARGSSTSPHFAPLDHPRPAPLCHLSPQS